MYEPTPAVAKVSAMQDAEYAYRTAMAVPYAPAGAIGRDWNNYTLELRRLPRSINVIEQQANDRAALPICAKAAATFRAWANKPQAELQELWAVENGRLSPRAVAAGWSARQAEQARKDALTREVAETLRADPNWSARAFRAELAKREVYLSKDDYGRIKVRGSVTDAEDVILHLKRKELQAVC